MFKNISLNFNWMDFLIIAIIIRIIYVGIKSKFLVELFRLLGILFAVFVTLHFFWKAGYLLNEYVFIPKALCLPFAFVLLWATSVLVFKLIGSGWLLLFRFETKPIIDKCIGVFLSTIRALFTASLILMLFFTTGNEYLGRISNSSFTGPYLVDFAPMTYKFYYDHLVKKCFPHEHLNVRVFGLKALGRKKKKK